MASPSTFLLKQEITVQGDATFLLVAVTYALNVTNYNADETRYHFL